MGEEEKALTCFTFCRLTQGFDEFMNLVLEDAEEIYEKKRMRKKLGEILLKGENILFVSCAR